MFNNLCNNQQTWEFLLKRDFGIEMKRDARKEYFGRVLKDLARKYNDRANELYRKFTNQELPPDQKEEWINEDRLVFKNIALSALGLDDQMGRANYLGQSVPNNIFGNIVGDQVIDLLLDTRNDLRNEYPNATLIDALLMETYGQPRA